MSVPFNTAQFAGPAFPVKRIPLDAVALSQHPSTMSGSKIERMRRTWSKDMDEPLVAERGGRYVILDGHHRAIAAASRGHKYLRARISQ